MKITINTTDKTVKIEEDAPIGEVILFLQKALPNWEEYKILSHEVVYHYYPYYQSPIQQSPYLQPWQSTYGAIKQFQ